MEESIAMVSITSSGRQKIRQISSSEYLTSYSDFVTANPLFVKGRGQFDGSVKYDVTDALQLRLQVSDILGTNTVLEQQVDLSGQRYRRAEIKGDRRIKFGLRYNFW